MISTSTRLRLKSILKKLANNETVSLKERIYLNKFADRDQTVSSWVRKAKAIQKNQSQTDYIDNLLDDLSIGITDPDDKFDQNNGDLGEWFSGVPPWVSRS